MRGSALGALAAGGCAAAGLTDLLAESFNQVAREYLTPDIPARLETTATAQPDDLHILVVDTSQYIQNYRHVTNSAAMYRAAQWLGVPDSNIHFMMGECSACDPRNVKPAQLFAETSHDGDLYREAIQTSHRGHSLTVDAWKQLISGRSHRFSPASRQLKSNGASNVMIFLDGHGGNQFTKFRDFDELSAEEIQETILELKIRGKFRKLLLFVDSCQALTLGDYLDTPDTMVIASSTKGNSAYSCNDDGELGISLMDRMSFLMLEFFKTFGPGKFGTTWQQLLRGMDSKFMMAEIGVRSEKFNGDLRREKFIDWFAEPSVAAAMAGRPLSSPFRSPALFSPTD